VRTPRQKRSFQASDENKEQKRKNPRKKIILERKNKNKNRNSMSRCLCAPFKKNQNPDE
jgi:hypothetical protein